MFQSCTGFPKMHIHFLIPASNTYIVSSFLMQKLWLLLVMLKCRCCISVHLTVWVITGDFPWHWVQSWRKRVVCIVEVWFSALLSIVTANISLLWKLYWLVSWVSGSFSGMVSLQVLESFNFTVRSLALMLERYQWFFTCWGFHFIWTFHTISFRTDFKGQIWKFLLRYWSVIWDT